MEMRQRREDDGQDVGVGALAKTKQNMQNKSMKRLPAKPQRNFPTRTQTRRNIRRFGRAHRQRCGLSDPSSPPAQVAATRRVLLGTTTSTGSGRWARRSQSVPGSWGETIRYAVRNKERWKRSRTPTQDPSTDLRLLLLLEEAPEGGHAQLTERAPPQLPLLAVLRIVVLGRISGPFPPGMARGLLLAAPSTATA